MEPVDAAVASFREAVRLGFPVYAKRLTRDAVLLRNNRGKGVLFVVTREDEEGVSVLLSADRYTVWTKRVALLRGGDAVYYPGEAVAAAGQHPVLFSTFEIDVWRRRVEAAAAGRGIESKRVPEALRGLAEPGCRVLHFPDLGDYALACGDRLVAWYNEVTGHVDDAREWQRLMGL